MAYRIAEARNRLGEVGEANCESFVGKSPLSRIGHRFAAFNAAAAHAIGMVKAWMPGKSMIWANLACRGSPGGGSQRIEAGRGPVVPKQPVS